MIAWKLKKREEKRPFMRGGAGNPILLLKIRVI
jgi:hypothetical protein